ncbi:MAG: mechanosensitive ion channel [Solirubrobacteraceae bacterium]|nr:mechanosensitive ion channel [Solirubrobacteraceae bacterium]
MTHLEALTLAATDSSAKALDLGDWIGAALTIILTAALVVGVRWALRQRQPLNNLNVDPGVRTRVRLLQRMGVTLVILIGIAVAAAQLGVLQGIASTVLATSAITAVVVGFAARTVLANALAGIVLTVTQPVRVGDQVKVGDHEGVVEDVTLSATILRTIHGTVIRIPNEMLAQSVVLNDTISGGGVVPETWVLIPIGSPVQRALDIAADLPGVELTRLMVIEAEGWNRIMVRGARCAPGDRVGAEARLRVALVEAFTGAGILPEAGSGAAPGQEAAGHL